MLLNHWHTKAVFAACGTANAWLALVATNQVLIAIGWIMVGFAIAFMITDTIVWRIYLRAKLLLQTVENQNKMIDRIAQMKMDEAAQQIAKHIADMTGRETEVIRMDKPDQKLH